MDQMNGRMNGPNEWTNEWTNGPNRRPCRSAAAGVAAAAAQRRVDGGGDDWRHVGLKVDFEPFVEAAVQVDGHRSEPTVYSHTHTSFARRLSRRVNRGKTRARFIRSPAVGGERCLLETVSSEGRVTFGASGRGT